MNNLKNLSLIDLEKEREEFEINWLSLGGKLDNFEYTTDQMYSLSKEASKKLSEQDKLISIMIINQSWSYWLNFARANQAEDEYRKVYNEKDHAELVADAAIEEINRLKQEERKYKEKHGQLIGKIHALEKKLGRYESNDYVLVPRNPEISLIDRIDSLLCFPDVTTLESYKAIIVAVENKDVH